MQLYISFFRLTVISIIEKHNYENKFIARISHRIVSSTYCRLLLAGKTRSRQQNTRSHVEIHGSDNIIPLVETYVDGNTLMIKFKKNVSIWKGKLEIKVFAPELNKLSINGSGNIKLINGIQTSKDIEFHINGSGNIQGEGLIAEEWLFQLTDREMLDCNK